MSSAPVIGATEPAVSSSQEGGPSSSGLGFLVAIVRGTVCPLQWIGVLAQAWLRRCSGGATHNTQTLDYSHQGHHAPRSDHVAQGLAAREPGDEQAWEGLFLPSVLSYVTLGQAVRLSPPSWLGSCSGVAMPPHRLTPTPSRKHKPPAAQIEPTRRAEDRVHPGGLRPGSQQP